MILVCSDGGVWWRCSGSVLWTRRPTTIVKPHLSNVDPVSTNAGVECQAQYSVIAITALTWYAHFDQGVTGGGVGRKSIENLSLINLLHSFYCGWEMESNSINSYSPLWAVEEPKFNSVYASEVCYVKVKVDDSSICCIHGE